MTRRERHFYIPPDVSVADDGTIAQSDWPSVYRLTNNRSHHILSFTGLGMPAIVYIDEKGPLQHGKTILDFRLEERFIQYTLRVDECSRDDYWEIGRGGLLNIVRPNRQTNDTRFQSGRLRVVRPNGIKRDIETIIQQGPAFAAKNPSQWDQWSFTETLRFKCADPTWFDPTINEVIWETEVYNGLIFKSASYPNNLVFPVNSVFGTDTLGGTASIAYTGTWFAYPIIQIVGPVYTPSIENLTLGTKIQLNYNVSNGEIVTIDTSYGKKTIMNNFGDNLIGTQSNDSDINLIVATHPYATNGINQFLASGSGAISGVTEIAMQYYTRYIGI